MKKVLLIAALSMVAAPAFASKARLNALQGADHLTDVQNSFEKPWQVPANGELATVEFGAKGAGAEGGFVRQMGEGYLGLYLGHAPTSMIDALGNVKITGATATTKEIWGLNSPFNVWYGAKNGDMTWGANFFYLASNLKTKRALGGGAANDVQNSKANAMGVSVGATNGTWDASLVLGLSGKASFEATGAMVVNTAPALAAGNEVTFTSKSNMKLMAGYTSDTLYYYGSYGMSGGKLELAGNEAADAEKTNIRLGVINSHKKDGTDFFYGIAYDMETTKEKIGDTQTDTTKLPLIVGVEAEANSWIVLRGSLTQSFPLLGSKKVKGGETDTLADDTSVAAGAAFKFNKFTMDTFMAASTSGNIGFDTPNFLTQTSLTYAF